MTSPNTIEARGLGRDYGAVRALEGLDLSIEAGSLVGILGPNGAGKTTALLMLATLLRPSRGSARVLGCDLASESRDIRRRLGLVFQEATIDGLLTVEENLRFAGRLAGLDGHSVRHAVDEVIRRVGLGPHRRRRVSELSGGWRRLTDIARATLHRPALLILDEPTVGLDPEHRERMWGVLDTERRERGVTVLMSTHYMTEAESADRVLLLARGVLVEEGVPAGLQRGIGMAVAEFEGPGGAAVEAALVRDDLAVSSMRTERGWRVGVREPHRVARLVAELPGQVTRFLLREPTLEDVYFLRTR